MAKWFGLWFLSHRLRMCENSPGAAYSLVLILQGSEENSFFLNSTCCAELSRDLKAYTQTRCKKAAPNVALPLDEGKESFFSSFHRNSSFSLILFGQGHTVYTHTWRVLGETVYASVRAFEDQQKRDPFSPAYPPVLRVYICVCVCALFFDTLFLPLLLCYCSWGGFYCLSGMSTALGTVRYSFGCLCNERAWPTRGMFATPCP